MRHSTGPAVNDLLTGSLMHAWPLEFDNKKIRGNSRHRSLPHIGRGRIYHFFQGNDIGFPGGIDPVQTGTPELKPMNFPSRQQLQVETRIRRRAGIEFIFRLNDKQ